MGQIQSSASPSTNWQLGVGGGATDLIWVRARSWPANRMGLILAVSTVGQSVSRGVGMVDVIRKVEEMQDVGAGASLRAFASYCGAGLVSFRALLSSPDGFGRPVIFPQIVRGADRPPLSPRGMPAPPQARWSHTLLALFQGCLTAFSFQAGPVGSRLFVLVLESKAKCRLNRQRYTHLANSRRISVLSLFASGWAAK